MIIYKTTNLINGKFYIGKDTKNNPNYYGSGLLLKKAILKYKQCNFTKEVIEYCKSITELNEREKYWINLLDATNKNVGYNLTIGGDGGDTYTHQSIIKKNKIKHKRDQSRSQTLKSIEYKNRISKLLKERWSGIDYKDKIKQKLCGRKILWSDKIGKSIKKLWETRGDVRSEETKLKVARINNQRRGSELKKVDLEMENRIINLYQTMGPILISRHVGVSPYIVKRILKKVNIYAKYQKGIGNKENKIASISKKGRANPNAK